MKRSRLAISSAATLALLAGAGAVQAAPVLRFQVEQKGDFILTGNTLGYECNPPLVAPVVGTVACGANVNFGDSAPDLFWQSDAPLAGQAQANPAVTLLQASSSAQV